MDRQEHAVTAYVIFVTSPRSSSAVAGTVAAAKPKRPPLPCNRMLKALPADQLLAIARELGLKGVSERMGCEALVRRIVAGS